MINNRIATRGANGGPTGSIQIDFLQAYADDLNRMNFSRGMGLHWFINKRTNEAGEVHYLDNRSVLDDVQERRVPIAKIANSLKKHGE